MKMNNLFKVNDKVYWYCNWFFWRDDYDTKICILVTENYAVFEYTEWDMEWFATVLNYSPRLLDEWMIDEWKWWQ